MNTIIALYDDFATARRAIEELVAAGYSRENISLVANDATKEYAGYLADDYDDVEGDEGAGFGAVVGALIGLGAMAIPGVGPVIAGGSLVAALTGAGLGAAAGAVTGGLTAALIDLGVPEADATLYHEGIRRGGALVSIQVPDDSVDVARRILNSYHPVDLDTRRQYYETTGWKGYDVNAAPYTAAEIDTHRENWSKDHNKFEVVEEDVKIGKREAERGGVRIHTYVTERPVEEDVELREEHIYVERQPVNRPATEADFATTNRTIELTEHVEEPVIQKEARVVEEVVVDKATDVYTETVHDTVRRKDVEIEELNTPEWTRYETTFRDDYKSRYANTGYTYEDYYLPAYRYGYTLATDPTYRTYSDWNNLEMVARREWEADNDTLWDDIKDTVRNAWMTVRREVDELL